MANAPGLSDATLCDLTTFTVKVGGTGLDPTLGVVAIEIERQVGRVPVARLVVQDGDAAAQDFPVSAEGPFVPGAEIEILGGYSSDETTLFKGVITRQRVEVRRRGGSRLHVEARDAAFRMTLERRSACFTDLTDADLFEQLVSGYAGLTPDVAPTSTTHQCIVQYQMTDWDLMLTRAERLGLLCLVQDGSVRLAKPDPGAEAVLSLAYGGGLFDVDLELDATGQFGASAAASWAPADQALLSADAEDVAEPAQGDLKGPDIAQATTLNLRCAGTLEQESLDTWAEAALVRSRFARIRGTVRFQGRGDVKPGDMVDLSGLGGRFNGAGFVSGVQHQLGGGDWETTIQIGLDPRWHHERWDVAAPAAAGLHPAVRGLQTGVVTQLQDDPSGEHRIRVRLPLVDAAGDGAWARVATLDAGSDRGSFFLPEIGDEVVVGFVEDDPNQPVVLGMLHSSAKPAPLAASDDNDQKGFTTRSGIRILVDDKVPSITIETAGGHQLVLDDGESSVVLRDSGGSSVRLDGEGVTIDSPAAVKIKAGTDVTIEGVNVTLKASASLGAEGSAGAALKSGGATEVKGSIVKIN